MIISIIKNRGEGYDAFHPTPELSNIKLGHLLLADIITKLMDKSNEFSIFR